MLGNKCTQRKSIGGQREDRQPPTSQGERSEKKPLLLAPWSWTSRPQSYEKINFHHLCRLVCYGTQCCNVVLLIRHGHCLLELSAAMITQSDLHRMGSITSLLQGGEGSEAPHLPDDIEIVSLLWQQGSSFSAVEACKLPKCLPIIPVTPLARQDRLEWEHFFDLLLVSRPEMSVCLLTFLGDFQSLPIFLTWMNMLELRRKVWADRPSCGNGKLNGRKKGMQAAVTSPY